MALKNGSFAGQTEFVFQQKGHESAEKAQHCLKLLPANVTQALFHKLGDTHVISFIQKD